MSPLFFLEKKKKQKKPYSTRNDGRLPNVLSGRSVNVFSNNVSSCNDGKLSISARALPLTKLLRPSLRVVRLAVLRKSPAGRADSALDSRSSSRRLVLLTSASALMDWIMFWESILGAGGRGFNPKKERKTITKTQKKPNLFTFIHNNE